MIRLLVFLTVLLLPFLAVGWLCTRIFKWKAARVALIMAGCLVAACLWLVIEIRNINRVNPDSIKRQALAALTKSGLDEVRKESGQIFKRFGVAQMYWFKASDLANYPAVASLGDVDFISAEDNSSAAISKYAFILHTIITLCILLTQIQISIFNL